MTIVVLDRHRQPESVRPSAGVKLGGAQCIIDLSVYLKDAYEGVGDGVDLKSRRNQGRVCFIQYG